VAILFTILKLRQTSSGSRRDFEVAVAVPDATASKSGGNLCVFFPTHDRLPCALVMHGTLETTNDRKRLVANKSNQEVLAHLHWRPSRYSRSCQSRHIQKIIGTQSRGEFAAGRQGDSSRSRRLARRRKSATLRAYLMPSLTHEWVWIFSFSHPLQAGAATGGALSSCCSRTETARYAKSSNGEAQSV